MTEPLHLAGSTRTAVPPDRDHRQRRTRPRWPWLLLLVTVVAGTVLSAPYLTLDAAASRIETRGTAHYGLLVAHIFTACVALVVGPLQFIPVIRARRGLHRALGRLYLFAGVLPSAVTAVPVALLSPNGLVTQVGLTLPALGWVVTGGLALRAARRRDIASHRDWMTRNYALTFLAVTSRVLVPLMLLAQIPVLDRWYDGSVQAAVDATIPVGQWLGWIVNLALAEVLIRRGRARTHRKRADPLAG